MDQTDSKRETIPRYHPRDEYYILIAFAPGHKIKSRKLYTNGIKTTTTTNSKYLLI